MLTILWYTICWYNSIIFAHIFYLTRVKKGFYRSASIEPILECECVKKKKKSEFERAQWRVQKYFLQGSNIVSSRGSYVGGPQEPANSKNFIKLTRSRTVEQELWHVSSEQPTRTGWAHREIIWLRDKEVEHLNRIYLDSAVVNLNIPITFLDINQVLNFIIWNFSNLEVFQMEEN